MLGDSPHIIKNGDSGYRFFGDFKIEYKVENSGNTVTCTFYLITCFVGIISLSPDVPKYEFDFQIGYGAASGFIDLSLNIKDEYNYSKLNGDFNYSGNKSTFHFRGTVVAWKKNSPKKKSE